MQETFTAWQRPQITERATGPIIHARRSAELLIDLTDDVGSDQGRASFLLAGPQDVLAMTPAAVIGRKPAPGTQDAEITRVAHVELAEPDLPWRYSPDPNDPVNGVRPWLVLVVGETGTEVAPAGVGQVRLSGAVFAHHDLARSAAWAHVHRIPGRPISRILCPRTLEEGKDWTAALVPAWQVVDGQPVAAWTAGTAELVVRCFDSWRFRTVAEDDDFRAIAQRLEPLTAAEQTTLTASDFGRARIAVAGADPRTAPKQLSIGGALTVVPTAATLPDTPLPKRIASHTRALAGVRAHRGRWVLGLPRYDEPWTATPDPGPADGWRRQLHEDPRHRGTAGLGAWAGIVWQDRIAEGAAAQAGALALLAERVRHLGLGLRAARSQWVRRVPDDPRAALSVLGPMLDRLPTTSGTSALDELADRTAWLVPGLFSSAARRMLRPRSSLARVARPGATRHPGLVAVAAGTCPPEPPPLAGQKDLPDLLADPELVDRAAELLSGESGRILEQVLAFLHDQQDHDGERGFDLGALAEQFDQQGTREALGWLDDRAESRCRPIEDLTPVAVSIAAAIDPTVPRPVVVDRVIGGVTGLRRPELAPPDLALELDIPLWSFLRDASPDWLLPGSGTVPLDRVLALQTNPEFVDAFLVGANRQTLGELRWRNLPIVAGWTPLRRFWQRITDDGSAPATDVRPVLDILSPPAPGAPTWSDASPLGDAGHQTGTPAAMLVVLLHTELFRRYPATQVYLMRNDGSADPWASTPDPDAPPDPDHPDRARVHPNLTGTLHPELVFFGFPLPPEAGTDHWLVLEEPPPGYRFRAPDDPALGLDPDLRDGGKYAALTLNRPIRAFFGNLL